jgi:hypothetical protein
MLKHLFPLLEYRSAATSGQSVHGWVTALWVCVHPISKETAEHLLAMIQTCGYTYSLQGCLKTSQVLGQVKTNNKTIKQNRLKTRVALLEPLNLDKIDWTKLDFFFNSHF